MKGYCYDSNTKEYIGEMDLQLDPLESKKQKKEVFLFAANTTLEKPIITEDGKQDVPRVGIPKTCNKKAFFKGNKWVLEDIPEPQKIEPVQPTEDDLLVLKEEQLIAQEIRKIAIKNLGSKLKKVKE